MNRNDIISKAQLRKTILSYRKLLDEKEFQERNLKITKLLVDFFEENRPKSIHLFLPIEKNNEPNLFQVIQFLHQKEIKTVISKTDFENRSMEHYIMEEDTEIKKNRLGIPEPINAVKFDKEKIDAVLVPLTLADRKGNRIGYGGGFYDQFLKETDARKIGVSLGPVGDKIIQADDWDIKLDIVITPFGIIRI